jgi:hypothetical protein
MIEVASKNAIISIPKKGFGQTMVSVLVFYPGIPIKGKIGRDYMPLLIRKAVPDWFDKYVIVIPNTHTTDWNMVEADYKKAMSESGLKQSDLSIGCFSGSGNSNSSIQMNLNRIKVNNLFLMDPVSTGSIVKNTGLLKSRGTSIYLMYNPNNWKSKYPMVAAGFSNLEQVAGENSINTMSKTYDHDKIPGKLLIEWKRDIESSLIKYKEMTVSNMVNTTYYGDSKIKENNGVNMKINECSCGCGGSSNNCTASTQSDVNYMFFGNLETIKRNIEELLSLDQERVDSILKNGHEWAVDHIASSMDDIQEVYNFLKNGISTSDHRKKNPFAERDIFIKTFESYVNEAKKTSKKKKDHDGDEDFADAKVAQYTAGSMHKGQAIAKSRKFNKK